MDPIQGAHRPGDLNFILEPARYSGVIRFSEIITL